MAGRPVEYNEEEVLFKSMQYLESCEDELITTIASQSKDSVFYKEKLKVKLPTIEGLARHLSIHRDTVYDWETKYEPFSDILTELRSKQAERLINNSLSGDYNPTIAKVLLTKHGYTDKQEIDQKTEITGSLHFGGIEMIRPNDPTPQVPTQPEL